MMKILEQQYTLVKSSREAVFNFIETQVGNDLNKPVAAYDDSTIRYLLVHNAKTYLHWLVHFAMQRPFALADDSSFTTINLIRSLFIEVDQAMATFLTRFADQMDTPMVGAVSRGRHVMATPLQLFTHVITHEFHHKGQMMSMCRVLGHIPPDTDVIRF